MNARRLLDLALLCRIDRLAVWWLERRTDGFTREIEPLLAVLRETQRPGDEPWTVGLGDAWQRGVKARRNGEV